jgi:hypothetical protein
VNNRAAVPTPHQPADRRRPADLVTCAPTDRRSRASSRDDTIAEAKGRAVAASRIFNSRESFLLFFLNFPKRVLSRDISHYRG